MMQLLRFSFILFVCVIVDVHALMDLEHMAQDFVLESKRIEIPGHPHAFNPSIIRWDGRLLLSFRVIPDAKHPYIGFIGLIWLDEDFNPCSEPQILNTWGVSPVPSRAEDARLVKVGERLFLIYSDCRDSVLTKGGCRVYFGELRLDGDTFVLEGGEGLLRWDGQVPERREKNWVPFAYNDTLLMAYSLSPHRVLRPLFGTCACETFAISEKNLEWNWGELRGGTPGIEIDDTHYLAFFHSMKRMWTVHSDKEMPHYFMGAYLYAKKPPFEITAVSAEPIVGKGFYHGPVYQRYWGSVRVVFPGGFLIDDKYIWVAYGRQDHEIWVVKLERQGLLDSLVPVDKESDSAN